MNHKTNATYYQTAARKLLAGITVKINLIRSSVHPQKYYQLIINNINT
jgi:hypothetical protein